MRKNLIYSWLLATLYLTVGLAGTLLTGCESWLPGAHKIDIQQGNQVNAEDLDRVKIGMTQEQVKYLLGTPLLQDSFHQNRWDYLYYLQPGNQKESRQSRISLFFEGGTLTKIDREQYKPAAQDKKGNNSEDEIQTP